MAHDLTFREQYESLRQLPHEIDVLLDQQQRSAAISNTKEYVGQFVDGNWGQALGRLI